MNPAATLDSARDLALGLLTRERARHGGARGAVQARVGRRIGVLPGTLETLSRGRLKRLEAWVLARLVAGTIEDLKREIRRHDRDLEAARRCAVDLDPSEVVEVEAHLAQMRDTLDALAPGQGTAAPQGGPERDR